MAALRNQSIAARLDLALAERRDIADRVALLVERAPPPFVFTTSFGLEDQVLTHVLVEAGLGVRFATLDTGRLFPETLKVWAATERRYGIRVAAFSPEADALRALLAEQGVEGFRDSVAARKECCRIRKVLPLGLALAGAGTWLTGLRAGQSDARAALPFAAYDSAFGVIKANPLADRSREEIAAFAEANGVPVNALHARGFPSIGCAPCTRAVVPGEPERAGRWWWENEAVKECGLHLPAAG